MEGLEFLFSIIGLGMLIHWLLVHDKRSDQPTQGFFAMRESETIGSVQPRRTRLSS